MHSKVIKRTMTFNAVYLMVYLGLHDFEQETRQAVKFDVETSYGEKVTHQDQIHNYQILLEQLQDELLDQRFLLIEELAEHVWSWFAQRLAIKSLRVSKIKPPLKVRMESATYLIEAE